MEGMEGGRREANPRAAPKSEEEGGDDPSRPSLRPGPWQGREERSAAQRSSAQPRPSGWAGIPLPVARFHPAQFHSISSVRVAAISQLLFNKKNSSYIILQ